jgi:hypothetical protein
LREGREAPIAVAVGAADFIYGRLKANDRLFSQAGYYNANHEMLFRASRAFRVGDKDYRE